MNAISVICIILLSALLIAALVLMARVAGRMERSLRFLADALKDTEAAKRRRPVIIDSGGREDGKAVCATEMKVGELIDCLEWHISRVGKRAHEDIRNLDQRIDAIEARLPKG